MNNFRPIAHLSFLSELAECIILARITSHLICNHLNSFQPAYTKFLLTGSNLLAVNDKLKARRLPQVTGLPVPQGSIPGFLLIL
jgi:hypothetical protein